MDTNTREGISRTDVYTLSQTAIFRPIHPYSIHIVVTHPPFCICIDSNELHPSIHTNIQYVSCAARSLSLSVSLLAFLTAYTQRTLKHTRSTHMRGPNLFSYSVISVSFHRCSLRSVSSARTKSLCAIACATDSRRRKCRRSFIL